MFNRKIGTISKKIHTPYEGMFGLGGTQGYEKEVTGTMYIDLTNAIANKLLELKAYGGIEQRNLPEGYTQVEYLRSDGTQYIDLGYKGKGNTKVEIKFKYYQTSSATGSGRVFGSRTTSSSDAFAIGSASGIVSSTGNKVFWCYNGQSFYVIEDAPFGLDEWQTVVFSATEHTVNGTTEGDDYTATTFETPANLKLFAFDNNGTIGCGYVDIAYCKLWDDDGTLVRDLIPAKNSSNVLGMYDTVTNTFLTNQGTGTFTAGAEAVPSPDTPMDIVSNNGVVKVRHQSGLPLGYTLLDYIQSSGSQYIDTLRVPNNTDIIEQKFKKNGTNSATCSWYGSMPSSQTIIPRIGIGSFSNQSVVTIFAGTNYTGMIGAADTNVHTLRFQATGITELTYTFDGVTGIIDASTAVTPPDMYEPAVELTSYLFARHGTNGVQTYDNEGTRIYYHREYLANGTLALNMVPCKNASNVVGMYDLVSGQFFTNAGTGDFTAGNPVSDPVEIYTDGTVETISVHGKNLYNPAENTYGYYIDANGVIQTSPYPYACYTGYIRVNPSTKYTLSLVSGIELNTIRIHNYNENKEWVSQAGYAGTGAIGSAFTLTITTASTAKYIRISVFADHDNIQLEQGSTATAYEPYYNGGTATAEMLLKVGDYQDVQSIIDGVVTRKVGVKVINGTEDWNYSAGWSDTTHKCFYMTPLTGIKQQTNSSNECLCSHFEWYSRDDLYNDKTIIGGGISGYLATNPESGRALTLRVSSSIAVDATGFKQWLAAQYTAGTPVIVIYPLATPTTETVTGQTMSIQAGNNTIEITQASIDNLQLYAKYKSSRQ